MNLLWVNKLTNSNQTIISRYVNKFGLRSKAEAQPESLLALIQAIQPVTDIDNILKNTYIKYSQTAVTATGWLTVFTVPLNKRWRLKSISGWNSSGTFTSNQIGISDGSNTAGLILYTAAGSTPLYQPYSDIIIPQNFLIRAYVDSKAVNGNYDFTAIVEEEDAY